MSINNKNINTLSLKNSLLKIKYLREKEKKENRPEIILLVYQRPHNLKKILQAFRDQTYKNFVVNIFNNNIESKEYIDEIVSNFFDIKINLRHMPYNRGHHAKFDFAMSVSGEIIIFLDDDMIPYKNFIRYMLCQRKTYKQKTILGWHAFCFVGKDYFDDRYFPKIGEEVDYIGSGSMIINKSALLEIKECHRIPKIAECAEDLWLCYYAKKYGYKLIRLGQRVEHIKDEKDSYKKEIKKKKELFNFLQSQDGFSLVIKK